MNEENNNLNNQFSGMNNGIPGSTPIPNPQSLGPIPPISTPPVEAQENNQMINPQPVNPQPLNTIPNTQNVDSSLLSNSMEQNQGIHLVQQTNITPQPEPLMNNSQPLNVIPNMSNIDSSMSSNQMQQNQGISPIQQTNMIPQPEPSVNNPQPEQSINLQPNLTQDNSISQQSANDTTQIQKHKKNNNILIIVSVVAIIAILAIVYATLIKGGKTLNCTMTDSSMGMDMKTNLTIKFKGNQANELNATITVDLGKYGDYKETFIDSFKDEFEQKEGIETNIKSDNDQVIIEMKATRAGMEVSGYVQDDTYDEVVKDLKAEGFTCK